MGDAGQRTQASLRMFGDEWEARTQFEALGKSTERNVFRLCNIWASQVYEGKALGDAVGVGWWMEPRLGTNGGSEHRGGERWNWVMGGRQGVEENGVDGDGQRVGRRL